MMDDGQCMTIWGKVRQINGQISPFIYAHLESDRKNSIKKPKNWPHMQRNWGMLKLWANWQDNSKNSRQLRGIEDFENA